MESEYTKLSKGTGSWHRMVDIFINSPNSGEHRIMDFQVEEKHSGLAIQLGNEIVRLIQKRLP
ncbi:MAG: hypothetical protein R8G66_13570 [Cytophagales bacterium]|nr:hypothetical protein [Cytophagales bacterium]